MRRALLALLLLSVACGTPQVGPAPGSVNVAEALGGDPTGYARADGPRSFSFPEDHGPHPDYRTEWWYFTGNLQSSDGDAFGFQFTIFRQALAPTTEPRDSNWATRDIWFAHVALGDERGKRFEALERFERGAAGLAGADSNRFHVWLADWRAESVAADSAFPVRLVVDDETFALDLTLSLDKPLVFQGEGGWSRKGAEIGNASYYYSATRLGATGSVRNARGQFDVTGSAWLDREWSTSVLSEGQTGWDWFSIQFDDGRDLMMYRLRREDGGNDPFNKGTLIEVDGTTIALQSDDLEFEPGRQVDGFHVEWTLRVKPLDLEIQVTPMLENSILPVSVRYWEGAIRTDPPGVGFMEMTTNEGLSR